MKTFSESASLVIIPTYHEAQNINDLILKIWEYCPDIHVLVVDDNSQDGTPEIVKSLQEQHTATLHLIQRAGKLGLGTAYLTGFRWALEHDYQAVVEMDADFSHNPSKLPYMLAKLGRYHAVVGSRYVEGGGTENWHPLRRFISRFGSFYARSILGVPIHDLTGGFNAWRREVLENINIDKIRSEGYSFQIELKYRCHRAGLSMCEIPILFSERREGQSKMSGGIVVEALLRVWALRFSVPKSSYRLSSGTR
ncbi:MAG: polyprenol monophosphomannose synthase [Oligoflexus sp.]